MWLGNPCLLSTSLLSVPQILTLGALPGGHILNFDPDFDSDLF